MPDLWQIDEAKTADHWLEITDPEGWYRASVKWDGCIHYYRYFNTPLGARTPQDERDDEPCYLHICDIDQEIARLTALKELAQQFFAGKQGQEYWRLAIERPASETKDAEIARLRAAAQKLIDAFGAYRWLPIPGFVIGDLGEGCYSPSAKMLDTQAVQNLKEALE